MELTGSVAGIINLLGGGSDVTITPLLLEGVRIAKITVDDNDFYIYAPEGGSDISVTPTLQSGTKIGDITIGENTVELYAPNPTSVRVSQEVTEGTLIGTITINGVTTNLYAPANSINYSNTEQLIGKYNGEDFYQKKIHIIETNEIISKTYTSEILELNAKDIFCLTARIMLGSVENYKWVTMPYFNSVNYNTALMLSNSDLVVISQGWKYKEIELITQYTKNS